MKCQAVKKDPSPAAAERVLPARQRGSGSAGERAARGRRGPPPPPPRSHSRRPHTRGRILGALLWRRCQRSPSNRVVSRFPPPPASTKRPAERGERGGERRKPPRRWPNQKANRIQTARVLVVDFNSALHFYYKDIKNK